MKPALIWPTTTGVSNAPLELVHPHAPAEKSRTRRFWLWHDRRALRRIGESYVRRSSLLTLDPLNLVGTYRSTADGD